MQALMYGRYGYDELSVFLSIAALVCILFSPFISLLNPIALSLLIWSTFRSFSRDFERRREEREVYLKYTGKVKQSFRRRKNMWRDRKTRNHLSGMQT